MADEAPAQNEIEFISGATNILLIAPHGHHLDDENTGALTRLAAEQNGCYAIINEVYRKPKKPNNDATADKQNKRVNLNRQNQVKKHLKKEFLDPLIKYKDEIVEKFGNVFLLWIHGADDASVRDDIKEEASVSPEEIKVLCGYGQDADEGQQRHTAPIETVQNFIDGLNQAGLNAISANDTIRKKNVDKEDKDKQKSFCAWDIHNMNQVFRADEHHDPNVESIQLEFRMADCRDTDVNIETTARRLAQAISPLVPLEIEDPIVEKAYNKVALVFSQNYEQALMETGQYIVRTFYGGEEGIEEEKYQEDFIYAPKTIENARNKKSPLDDSLRQLYAKISDDKERNTPSQAWIYNAVNLVVLQYDMEKLLTEEDHFQTFRNLLLSQKLFLLSVEDDIRKKVIEDCHGKTLTVKQFKALLAGFQSKEDSEPLKLSAILRKPEELEKEDNISRLDPERLIKEKKSTLNGLKKIAENKHDTAQSKIDALKKELEKWERYSQNCDAAKGNIEKAIESKDKAPKKKPTKAKPKSEKSENPSP